MQKESFVIRFRWPIIIAGALLSGIMGIQLKNMEITADPLFMFSPAMSSRINTEKIEKIFGSNDMLFVMFETADVLEAGTLERVQRIGAACKTIAGIKNVLSLFDAKAIIGEDGVMIVEPAVKAIPTTAKEREHLRNALAGNELVRDVVVSRDFTATAILLTLDLSASKQDVYKAVRTVIAREHGNEKVLIGGIPAFQTVIIHNITRDVLVLIPAAVLIILAILYGFFRRLRGIALPLAVVLLSTVFGMGILPLMGWKMTLLSAILPIMVVAFSNNYAIYLIARYQELCHGSSSLTRNQIATDVFHTLYKPILFSGITTMVGLLGMLSHAIIPAQQIGVAAAVAIGFSLFLSLCGIPAALSLLRLPRARPSPSRPLSLPLLDVGLRRVATLVTTRPKTVLFAAMLIALAGIGLSTRIVVDANQENLFSKNHPISQCTRQINAHFGGTQNISILFESDIKDPRFLKKLEAYKDTLLRLPGVSQVASIADVIRIMSRALNDSVSAGYNRIPETRDAVAQYLELYAMSGNPDDFERLVDFNYEKAQCIVRINNGATPMVNRVVQKIGGIAKNDPEIVTFGGWAAMFAELAAEILKGQVLSIAFALCAIVILVMLMFRSLAAGLFAALPLVFAMVVGFGVMGAFGINLDMATALITSIVIGTGVDFTLQFTWRYRAIRMRGLLPAQAVQETFAGVGRAIVFNAVCITSGLGVLILSSIPPLRHFAILFGVLTVACMIGTLLIIPALCLVIRPRFLEPREESPIKNSITRR